MCSQALIRPVGLELENSYFVSFPHYPHVEGSFPWHDYKGQNSVSLWGNLHQKHSTFKERKGPGKLHRIAAETHSLAPCLPRASCPLLAQSSVGKSGPREGSAENQIMRLLCSCMGNDIFSHPRKTFEICRDTVPSQLHRPFRAEMLKSPPFPMPRKTVVWSLTRKPTVNIFYLPEFYNADVCLVPKPWGDHRDSSAPSEPPLPLLLAVAASS